MQDVYILGAGGFAREIYELVIKAINRIKPTYHVIGFLDDDPHAMDGKVCDIGIVGSIHGFPVKPEDRFIMGVANPQTKEKLAAYILGKGADFVDAIHPSVNVVPGATYGKGLVMYPGGGISPDVHIGDFVTILHTGIGHDAQIGDYTTISSYCGINGYVKLGKRVFVGGNAVICPGIQVGDDAYVGMGSVVVTKVKAGTKVFGNPAKRMDF